MNRAKPERRIVRQLELGGVPEGKILQPLEAVKPSERALFEAWETPLAPWGGFAVDSGLIVLSDGGRLVLEVAAASEHGSVERAMIARGLELRDGTISAEFKPLEASARPNDDRNDCTEALAGIVFRVQTSRWYYQFGIEGMRRAVLYRRMDDEWRPLASQEVTPPDGYVTLVVELDGDGMRCASPELGVDFLATDTTYRWGKVGFRSLNRSRLAAFMVEQTPSQSRRRDTRTARLRVEEDERGRGIPDATLLRTYSLAEIGGSPIFRDFAEAGRFDLFVEGTDRTRALSADGTVLWELEEPLRRAVFSRQHTAEGRLVYGFTGEREVRRAPDVSGRQRSLIIEDEMIVVRGKDGKVLARAKLPPAVPTQRFFDFSPTSAALSNKDGTDVVLREWRDDRGGGGIRLWALDRNLRPLWQHEQAGAWYGHHWALAFFDVDGDGFDELLAGGKLYDRRGRVLWVHDRDEELGRIWGASHYDAVHLGRLSGDDEIDPVAFLVAGSAGVYVVDALTGRTRAVHRVGHAQGITFGKVRDDVPGEQMLVATRWCNYGILTLFSGRGERLWTIQPDYVGQGATPIRWGRQATPLVWTNTTADAQAFWDGHGRRAKRLVELSRVWGERMGKDVRRGGSPIRLGTDPTDCLTLACDGTVHVFGPAE